MSALRGTVSAPGKALILGDYAVLAGGRAMIAAIDVRAVGRLGSGPSSSVVEAVLKRAGVERQIAIDTAQFQDARGQKLGLGSSSAVAVVTAALAAEPSDVLQVALEGHRAASGGTGSGVDVAASFSGGIIVTSRQPAPIEALPLAIPGLHFAILYAGESRQTAPMVAAVEASSAWKVRQKPLLELSDAGIAAWRSADPDAFLEVLGDYGRQMAELGEKTGTPIVIDRVAHLMARAIAEGAAAKPSGAGGGDITILYSKDPTLAARLATESGSTLLAFGVDPQGLRSSP